MEKRGGRKSERIQGRGMHKRERREWKKEGELSSRWRKSRRKRKTKRMTRQRGEEGGSVRG